MVNDLLSMVDQYNVLTKSFRHVRNCLEQCQNTEVTLQLFRHRPSDACMYNLPSMNEVVALIVEDFDSSDCGRDIILQKRDGQL